MDKQNMDFKENTIHNYSSKLLDLILKDWSSNKNIIWATKYYEHLGKGYEEKSEILLELITGDNGEVIKPRIEKTKDQISSRTRYNGEVFTPSWICNKQNNLIDNNWFGYKNVFNQEKENTWITNEKAINFPEEKTWKDYVLDTRLEVTCGEAPYLTSRYDTVTGEFIEIKNRIGLLDRKLRIVSENANNQREWLKWAKKALENIYGYEYQGDNLLLARENILFTYIDYYNHQFNEYPNIKRLYEIAEVISWNIWQMDALKYVIPLSCHKERKGQTTLFGEICESECLGCQTGKIDKHNGIYSQIKDWKINKTIKFLDLVK